MSDTSTKRFLTAQEKRDLSSATLRALRSDLYNFRDWWEAKRQRPFTVSQLVSRDLRQWQLYCQQVDGVSPHTINRNLSSLHRFCGWAVTNGLLSANPATAISDIPQAPPSPRSLPTGAIDALLCAPQQIADEHLRLRDEALLSLLVYAGLRTEEARDLQLRDVDLAGASLVVRRGKGKKAHRIPLHTEARQTLTQYLEQVRCPQGMPAVGSEAERESFLLGMRMSIPGRPPDRRDSNTPHPQTNQAAGHIAAGQLRQNADQISD